MLCAPSLLASHSWLNLAHELRRLETRTDIDALHIDVMDGHFVPNMAFGIEVVQAIREDTPLPLDIHLMISCLDVMLEQFIALKPRSIWIHSESTLSNAHIMRHLEMIKVADIRCGLALNPATEANVVAPFTALLDNALIMTVEPGFCGQTFMPEPLCKIMHIKQLNPHIMCWVDGGVTYDNLEIIAKAGADGVVMGSAFYSFD